MKPHHLVTLYAAILIALMGGLIVWTTFVAVDSSFDRQIQREQESRMRVAWDLIQQHGTTFELNSEGNLQVGDTVLDGNNELVRRISKLVGGNVTIFKYQQRVATNMRLASNQPALNAPLSDRARQVLWTMDQTDLGVESDGSLYEQGVKYREEGVSPQGESISNAYDFIRDSDKAPIGLIEVGIPLDPYKEALGEIQTQSLIFTGIATLAIGVVVYFALQRLSTELRRVNKRAKVLLDSVREGVLGLDFQGRCTFANDAACMYLGFIEEELVGKELAPMLHFRPEGSQQVSTSSFLTRSNPDDLNSHADEFRRADGSAMPVRYNLAPVIDDDKVSGHVLTFLNVSEERKAEQSLKAMTDQLEATIQAASAAHRAKTTFFNTTSKEISNVVQRVEAAESNLLALVTSPEQVETIDNVRKSAEELTKVNATVLDFTELESGTLKLEEEQFELAECLEAAIDRQAIAAAEHQVALSIEASAMTPSTLIADTHRVGQIIDYLLQDSIQSSTAGSTVALTVNAKPADDGVVDLRFVVGGGQSNFSAEKLAGLFKAYVRNDDEVITEHGSGGLGLVVANKLATLMGGNVGMAPIDGEDEKMFFTVKVRVAPGARLEPFEMSLPQLHGSTAILIEKPGQSDASLALFASRFGVEIHRCPDPREATATAQSVGAHLMILGNGVVKSPEEIGSNVAPGLPVVLLDRSAQEDVEPRAGEGRNIVILKTPVRSEPFFGAMLFALYAPVEEPAEVEVDPA